nr:uncharacterized protein LOC113706765 [Coffea arabica]XP_027084553.1 uncharacterized protein LOC113706766 [Coffea arabica]
MEEKQLNHLSHEEHPLILSELQKKKDNGSIDQKLVVCYGCQEQTLDPAAYCCFACDFFLHKKCAELPQQITHPMHSQHHLVLLRNPTYSSRSRICSACGQDDWKFSNYHCSLCEFDLDCHEHPLRQQGPATFYCNACRKVDDDSSYLSILDPKKMCLAVNNCEAQGS